MKINEVISGKTQGVTEAQSAKTGIYQTDVLGAKAYHAKCMEPNCGWESKRFDRIKQAQAAAEKHAKSHFKQGVAEGKQPGKSVVDAILRVMPVAQEIWFHGSRATGKHRRNSDTDILVVVPDNLVGDKYLSAVIILQKLNSHFDNYDIQPTKTGTNIHRIAQEEGRLLYSKQGVAEGAMKDLHIDLLDQQWDAIVGYVINGLKKNMDIGRIELNLYKYAGQEMFDVDQELQDRGFKDIADLADHIRQHNGRYVPPTDFNLGKGVAEGLNEADASAVQFRTASTDNYQSSFTVTAIADGKTVGHFSFFRDPETDEVHNQAEVTDDVRGKGYGKALLLKAIEVANDHGLGFQEDSQSLSRAQSRVYDSLYDAGWIVDADGYWFLTPNGEQELSRLSTVQQGVAENFADGKVQGKSRPGRVKRAGASCDGSVSSLRAKAKKYGGERGKMYHWCANMKSGRKK